MIFEVDWVDDDRVSFKSFSLLRITRNSEGEEQIKRIYSADITVKAGKPLLVVKNAIKIRDVNYRYL